MALQMTGGGDNVAFGPRCPGSGHPDLDWLAAELAGPRPPKLVVITNPCNPTGAPRLASRLGLCGGARRGAHTGSCRRSGSSAPHLAKCCHALCHSPDSRTKPQRHGSHATHPRTRTHPGQAEHRAKGRRVLPTGPPTGAGVLMTQEEVERAAALCGAAGAWLVLDNTYEHFTFGQDGDGAPRQHHCVAAPHVVNIFSFSKAGIRGRPGRLQRGPRERALGSSRGLQLALLLLQFLARLMPL